MAITLPARPAAPATGVIAVPENRLDPGLPVLDTHALNVVEGHHYLCAYWGRRHWADHFPGRNTATPLNPGMCEETLGARTVVLEYLMVPRSPGLGLTIRYRVDSDNGLDIWLTAGGVTATRNYAAGGINYGTLAVVFGAPAPDTLTVATIEIQRAAGGTWCAIYECSGYDTDLTAGTLP